MRGRVTKRKQQKRAPNLPACMLRKENGRQRCIVTGRLVLQKGNCKFSAKAPPSREATLSFSFRSEFTRLHAQERERAATLYSDRPPGLAEGQLQILGKGTPQP